ncbi:SDR family oxidoreductase [Methylophilus methylotrophus]|uniref:SDR family oxidoreductase n=1 Tax=Methylophilus methylotrophus TaxID=17 RepID=UPI00036DAB21|nr:SDR family oxidoreductase [Methylophilus methylotrophus]
MHIFLTGSSGFIGRHLLAAFIAKGHSVTCAVRALPEIKRQGVRYVIADFSLHIDPQDWLSKLDDIDIVVNAVGIIRQNGNQTFETLHTKAPIALFAASQQKGVKLVLQISALGADENATSHYHLSKKAADDYLKNSTLPAIILQPSLVYGPGGKSASLFNTLASLPVLVKLGHGQQMVQPVHIDDLIETVIRLLSHRPHVSQTIAVVGPIALSFTEFIRTLRQAMKLPAPLIATIPLPVARPLITLFDHVKHAPLDREMFEMLERGNTADASAITALLGRLPRQVSEFFAPAQIATVRRLALLNWLLPILRASLAIVWLVTGVISFGVYPVSDSYELLARVGVSAGLAPWMLYGAASLDLAIGVAILCIHRKWIWHLQLMVIIAYSLIIAWKLPEFLVHPYGPVLKNLPMLAAIWLMSALEES